MLELDQLDVDDDYFALGGDSVHAIVIVAKLEQAGFRITAQDLFDLPTVRALARRAERDAGPPARQPSPPPPPAPLSASGPASTRSARCRRACSSTRSAAAPARTWCRSSAC
ncbi:phosphopantetheine-binding protein [Streptomyces sp. M19]